MSVVTCDKCNKQIDTDFDVDCYDTDEYKAYGEVICQSCRDNRDELAYERQQQSLMDGDHLEAKVKQDQELRAAGRGHLVR